MPVGPYKSFGTCVAAQKRKGHSEESARKICGEIEKRFGNRMVEARRVPEEHGVIGLSDPGRADFYSQIFVPAEHPSLALRKRKFRKPDTQR